MKDIGEIKDVREQEKLAKARAASRALVIRVLCQKREGRDFLWWILEQGSPYSSAMRRDADGRGDPMSTAYASGWHDLGALVMQEVMAADASGYVRMLSENRNIAELEKMKEETDESRGTDN